MNLVDMITSHAEKEFKESISDLTDAEVQDLAIAATKEALNSIDLKGSYASSKENEFFIKMSALGFVTSVKEALERELRNAQ